MIKKIVLRVVDVSLFHLEAHCGVGSENDCVALGPGCSRLKEILGKEKTLQ